MPNATERGIKGGVRINLDALNAKQWRYTTKRDLAQARGQFPLSGRHGARPAVAVWFILPEMLKKCNTSCDNF